MDFAKGERGERRMVLGALGLILLLLAFAPRNERALFILSGPDAQAFAALTPTPNPVYTATYGGVGGGDARSPRGSRGARGLPRGGTAPIGSTPDAPVAAAPTQLASLPDDLPGLGAPGADTPGASSGPPGGGLPGDFPGLPGTFEPGLPGVDEVIPPVPEPSTWMMLIAGFGLIGAMARRRARPARSVEAKRVAIDGDAVHARQDVLS